jgi:hypothetical protein
MYDFLGGAVFGNPLQSQFFVGTGGDAYPISVHTDGRFP